MHHLVAHARLMGIYTMSRAHRSVARTPADAWSAGLRGDKHSLSCCAPAGLILQVAPVAPAPLYNTWLVDLNQTSVAAAAGKLGEVRTNAKLRERSEYQRISGVQGCINAGMSSLGRIRHF